MNTSEKVISSKNKLIFISILVLCLAPYLFISLYSNPAADDFFYAYKGINDGIIQTSINEYFGWNGRYTSNLLVTINPITYGSFFLYKVIPILIIIFTIISFFAFVKTILDNSLQKTNILIIALVLTLLFLYQMPIISEGIYWYTGAVTYHLGNIFTLFYFVTLIMLYKEQYVLKNKKIHLGVLTMLLFFTIGFNEVIMIFLLLFSFIHCFIVYRNTLKSKLFANYLVIVTVTFSALVYFAPGNAIREDLFANNHELIHSVAFSIAQTFRFFFKWTFSIPLMILSEFYFYLNRGISENNKIFSVSFYLTPIYSTCILFGIIFICVFPAYWSTGILGQHRTLNVAYYLFIIFWFMNLTVWFNFYQNKLNNIKNLNLKTHLFLTAVMIFSFAFTKNGYDAISDIFYEKARAYNEQMEDRYDLIKSKNDTVYFDPISNPSRLLSIYDISEAPDNWINVGYTLYFGCKEKTILKRNVVSKIDN